MIKEKYYETKVDELNRITIPGRFRKKLGCRIKKDVVITEDDKEIALSFKKECMLCGNNNEKHIVEFKNKTICKTCVNAITHNELLPIDKSNKIIRKTDEYFRVVLPEIMLRNLQIHSGNTVYLYMEDGVLFIKPNLLSCVICNEHDSLIAVANLSICKNCMNELSKLEDGDLS